MLVYDEPDGFDVPVYLRTWRNCGKCSSVMRMPLASILFSGCKCSFFRITARSGLSMAIGQANTPL